MAGDQFLPGEAIAVRSVKHDRRVVQAAIAATVVEDGSELTAATTNGPRW